MVAWQDFFESKPNVCGGEVCAAGTRIPVTVILDSLAERRDFAELPFSQGSSYRRRSQLCSGAGTRRTSRADSDEMKFKVVRSLLESLMEMEVAGRLTVVCPTRIRVR
jgi:hypothetical protein